MDFSTLNDEELADHLNQVLAEQERRKALAEIPEQIRELTAKYLAGGGNVEDLQTSEANDLLVVDGPSELTE